MEALLKAQPLKTTSSVSSARIIQNLVASLCPQGVLHGGSTLDEQRQFHDDVDGVLRLLHAGLQHANALDLQSKTPPDKYVEAAAELHSRAVPLHEAFRTCAKGIWIQYLVSLLCEHDCLDQS